MSLLQSESVEQDGRGRPCLLFLTGTRADFGKLKPLIQRIDRSGEFDYRIFATGMHMLSRYGSTVIEVEKAGFRNVFAFMNHDSLSTSQMDLVLATTVQGLARYTREFHTDMIVVHGDRVETLAGAIVGALNNILVAHIEGGELSGTVDELIRHAVSKLSHLHFVANEEARARLLQMGERDQSVFVIGSPDIDVMLSDDLPDITEVKRYYGIDFHQYGVFIYHPVTTERHQIARHVAEVLTGLKQSNRDFVAIYPNNDAGSEHIQLALEELRSHPRFRLIPSMRFEYFLSLLKHADMVVGNSSAGIREAPVYGVPSINIGSRQQSRFSWPSIVNVGENAAEIVRAIRLLPSERARSLHFGNGCSAELFLQALRSAELWSTSRQKQFQDLVAPPSSVVY
jgi:UDP-N-acetylglucosamine 2-epimerase (hydrolysing)